MSLELLISSRRRQCLIRRWSVFSLGQMTSYPKRACTDSSKNLISKVLHTCSRSRRFSKALDCLVKVKSWTELWKNSVWNLLRITRTALMAVKGSWQLNVSTCYPMQRWWCKHLCTTQMLWNRAWLWLILRRWSKALMLAKTWKLNLLRKFMRQLRGSPSP